MRRVAAGAMGALLVLILAAPASAQAPAPPAPSTPDASEGEPQADIEVGVDVVTWLRNKGLTHTYKGGWHAGASYRISRLLNVVAAATGDYRGEEGFTANIYTYTGGIRVQSGTRGARFKPFVQVMLGGGQDNGVGDGTINRYPVLSPGVGGDLALSRRVSARVTLDFPLLMTFGDPLSGQISAGHTLKGTRITAGVSLPLGSRRNTSQP